MVHTKAAATGEPKTIFSSSTTISKEAGQEASSGEQTCEYVVLVLRSTYYNDSYTKRENTHL
jgi:hypothetical protein